MKHVLDWRYAVAALLAFAIAVAAPGRAAAQPTPPAPRIAVYLDCQNVFCDFDYLRTELAAVDWVRDRQVADVHLLVTGQETGAGGREYSVTFMGLRHFEGVADTLRYVAPPSVTDDERRRGLARMFRLGLVRYFARTPQSDRVSVEFAAAPAASASPATKDRWNAWVFRLSVSGFGYGEESYKDFNGRGNVQADRITERWKTRLEAGQSYSESRQTYPVCADTACATLRDTTVIVIRRGYNRTALQVRSLSPHWSAGVRASMSASRFQNHRRVIRAFPAVEYNLFPYSESTRRQARAEYNIGFGHYAYNDSTINDKLEESLPLQRLLIGVAFREPWGSIDVGANATSYLHDRSVYRLGSYGEFSIRLIKGLNLDLYGSYERIRDQFNLAKKNFSPEEILTRQFQLGSGYSFWGNVRLSYTFGSIFNSVVNPRMTNDAF